MNSILQKLKFKDEQQKLLWQKIFQNIKKKLEKDARDPEKIKKAQIKTLADFVNFNLFNIVDAVLKQVNPSLPQIWTGYIDKVENKEIMNRLKQVQAKFYADPQKGWPLMTQQEKDAIGAARVKEILEDFNAILPREVKEKFNQAIKN